MFILLIILTITQLNILRIYENQRLDYATDLLVSDLKYSKLLAYSKGYEVHFYFIKENNEEDFNAYSIVQGLNTLKRVYLPVNVVISRSLSNFSENNKLIFNPNGSVSPYACSIVLKDKNSGKTKKVTLTIGFTRITGI